MSDKIKLGTQPDMETDGRDAVHIAIVPVIAAEKLKVGQAVALNDKGEATIYGDPIGIVDPFRRNTKVINKGETAWLCLWPNTITSLRHVWEHPNFPDSAGNKPQLDNTKSAAWRLIKEIANKIGVGDYELVERAKLYIEYDYYWSEGDRFESVSLPESFWPVFETVTGMKVNEDKQHNFFSCSC